MQDFASTCSLGSNLPPPPHAPRPTDLEAPDTYSCAELLSPQLCGPLSLTGACVFLAGFGLPGFAFTWLPVHLGARRIAESNSCDHTIATGHGTR